MTVTVTIDLSPGLAERFSQLPDKDGFVTEAVAERLARTNGATHEPFPTELGKPSDYPTREAYVAEAQRLAVTDGLDPDLMGSLARGIAEGDAGEDISLEEADELFKAHWAQRSIRRNPK